jgi:ferrous iron transport protein B
MYLLGIVVALLMAWLFKKTLLKGETPMLIMELPPYKRPLVRVVLRHMWDRSKMFLRRAGTVILGINILLWFLATYPRSATREARFDQLNLSAAKQLFPDATNAAETIRSLQPQFASYSQTEKAISALDPAKDAQEIARRQSNLPAADPKFQLYRLINTNETLRAGENLKSSFAGMTGRAIEPVIAPLGFDWKMGIGIVASFAAREVFVSTMATVYNVGNYDETGAGMANLEKTLRNEKRPNGTPVYTALTAVTLMVFYVFALQCVSTVAIVRRETNSWKWPIFQWVYMGVLAWVLAFITIHGGHLLGYM